MRSRMTSGILPTSTGFRPNLGPSEPNLDLHPRTLGSWAEFRSGSANIFGLAFTDRVTPVAI